MNKVISAILLLTIMSCGNENKKQTETKTETATNTTDQKCRVGLF